MFKLLVLVTLLAAVTPLDAVASESSTHQTGKPIAQYPSTHVYRNLMVPMRDGVRLATDVFVPSQESERPELGRFAALLIRTPYGKGNLPSLPPASASLITLSPHSANSRGYVLIQQDVRGTSGSEGTFDPMINEGQDGFDTIEWLRKQPWSNGQVATLGPSYLGGNQMLLAAAKPPGLVTAFSQVAATDQFKNGWVYMDGVLDLATAAGWTLGMVPAIASRVSGQESPKCEQSALRIGEMIPTFKEIVNDLPLTQMAIVRCAPWWSTWLTNWNNPSHFEENRMDDRIKNISVPILHLGGWYDLFLRNTYQQYRNISATAKDSRVRANQRLVIGPWSHGSCQDCEPNSAVDAEAMQLAWMDKWIKRRSNSFFDYPVVLYVMGENRWRSEDGWPIGGTTRTHYYLHSRGRANSSGGDGELSTSLPGTEQPDRYRYDPRNPAPTLGGVGLSGSRAIQNEAESRSDILIFTSSELTDEVEVTGEVSATLFAASSAGDTDWWLKLIDVAPDGTAYILNQGVARARYRQSRISPVSLTPDKIEKYDIDMWATSNVFKKGHRIRLEVTSSNFPYADRNPNAFIDLSTATEKDYVVAFQTVLHDVEHASFVDLPIIPMSRHRHWIETPFPYPKVSAGGGVSVNEGCVVN